MGFYYADQNGYPLYLGELAYPEPNHLANGRSRSGPDRIRLASWNIGDGRHDDIRSILQGVLPTLDCDIFAFQEARWVPRTKATRRKPDMPNLTTHVLPRYLQDSFDVIGKKETNRLGVEIANSHLAVMYKIPSVSAEEIDDDLVVDVLIQSPRDEPVITQIDGRLLMSRICYFGRRERRFLLANLHFSTKQYWDDLAVPVLTFLSHCADNENQPIVVVGDFNMRVRDFVRGFTLRATQWFLTSPRVHDDIHLPEGWNQVRLMDPSRKSRTIDHVMWYNPTGQSFKVERHDVIIEEWDDRIGYQRDWTGRKQKTLNHPCVVVELVFG